MLFDLTEAEGSAVARVLTEAQHPALRRAPHTVAALDYLFWGRSPDDPQVWIAGALTLSGASATGSGLTLRAALWSVVGEAAESTVRARNPPTSGPQGFGAHARPDLAARHASQELHERLALGQWWDGTRPGRSLDPARLAVRLARLGLGRRGHRAIVGVQVPMRESVAIALVSFDRGGVAPGFCIGTALRRTLDAALRSAALELAQSEFGLALARMKRDRVGAGRLTPADRLNLRLAEGVCPAALSAHLGAARGPDPGLPDCRLEDLGSVADELHVVRASPASPPPPRPADRPFGALDIFAVPT